MNALTREVVTEGSFSSITVGVIGLGSIGGSLARAYKKAGAIVYGYDIDKSTIDFVKLAEKIDCELDESNMNSCDFIFLAIPVGEAIKWIKTNMPLLSPSTAIIDCCGIKRQICEVAFPLSLETGVPFIGGHPMAGRQQGGFKNSADDMFENSVFALTPRDTNELEFISGIMDLLRIIGVKSFSIMTPEEHDRVIAFTSQMAHVLSSAFVKSDSATNENSYLTGGSFKDMTRVALLDENMWTELLMDNRDNVLSELNAFTNELERFKRVLSQADSNELKMLLTEGKIKKAAYDAKFAICS